MPVHGLESPATRHVRENANLLVRSPGLFDVETWTGAGRYIASTALIWVLFLLPLVTAIFLATMLIPNSIWSRVDPFDSTQSIYAYSLANNLWFMTVPAWFLGAVLVLGVPQGPWPDRRRRGDKYRHTWIRRIQWLLLVGMGLTALGDVIVLGLWGYHIVLTESREWVQPRFPS